MKLSDVKGGRTLEVIADLIDPIANIVEDEDAMELLKREQLPEGMDAQQFFAKKMRKAIPVLLRTHRGDIVAILSTIKGVTPDEYERDLTLASVIGDVFELITDEEFLAFLA